MMGICNLSEQIKRDVQINNKQNEKINSIEDSIRQIYDLLNYQEQKLNEKQKVQQVGDIDELKKKIDTISDKSKDVVTVSDLNACIEDIHESFMIFLNNTPRSDVTELRDEIKYLKAELVHIHEELSKKPTFINLEGAMEVKVDETHKIKKLDIPKLKKK